MKVIVLSDELLKHHIESIQKTADEIGADICFVQSEEEIRDSFRDAEVIYGKAFKTAADSKSLKWLCCPWSGVDSLLKPGIFANENCIITNSAGAYGVSISEHIIMVSLMMMRKMTTVYPKILAGEWIGKLPQKSLKDCRITVLGTGDIGCCFAKRVKAFEPGCIIGVCRSGICSESAFDRILSVNELDEVLPQTELLVMCLPETAETKGILSKRRIDLLPEGAFIVNVGRGSAVDEDALAESLENGKISGAALDVFTTEPLPKDSKLWNTRNLLITPHVAGNLTIDYTRDRNVEMFCEDLIRYAKGEPLKNLVDREKGY